MEFICRTCGNKYDDSFKGWRCECGGSLWLNREVEFKREDIRQNDFTQWRYDKAYPIKKEELISTFGEGMTPLVKDTWENIDIYIKNDALMPTGSFKDRGVAMMINYLALKGVKKITEDSSGNAGASVAEYAAKAGIECSIYVPEGTSEGKIGQVISSGAMIHQIPGPREETARAAQSDIEGVYASHNWNPYFIEGVKSIAYELWEQFNFSAPDNIIVPTGNGSLPLALEQGFQELLKNGEVKHLPKIYGIQTQNCNPIYRKFHGLSEVFDAEPTVGEGIALKFSSHIDEVIKAIQVSKGNVLEVTEEEILQALRNICKKGYFIEPTSATAFAGASKLIKDGIINSSETTVIVISGNGLKASNKILKYINMNKD
ncbi:MAG: threonine synthase [Tissierellaceae bacterium]|nr:threonine synthase [Tissierellaceae bacterium]